MCTWAAGGKGVETYSFKDLLLLLRRKGGVQREDLDRSNLQPHQAASATLYF